MNRFDLRPRTVGEIFDAAFRIWWANLRTLVPLVACVVVPLQVALAIVLLITVHHGGEIPGNVFALHFHFVREPNGTVRNTEARHIGAGTEIGALVVPLLAQLLVTAACVRAIADVVAGASPSIAASLAAALRRAPALVALFVIRSLGVFVGLLLLIVPGVWAAGAWSVSVPALVLEGAGPPRALRGSAHLVRGRWWPVFGTIVVADLAVGIVSTAVQAALGAIEGFSSHPPLGLAVLMFALGAIVIGLIVQPVSAAVRVVLYLDLRIRHGGEELAALAHQLGVEAPPPPPASPGPGSPRGPKDPPYWPPPPGWTPPDDGADA